jgi:methionyl-tRNA formyltransferase
MRIHILIDNPKSWCHRFTPGLCAELKQLGHQVLVANTYEQLTGGDLLFLLSCIRLVPNSILRLYSHVLVIHESALPRGRGWSPLTCQVL